MDNENFQQEFTSSSRYRKPSEEALRVTAESIATCEAAENACEQWRHGWISGEELRKALEPFRIIGYPNILEGLESANSVVRDAAEELLQRWCTMQCIANYQGEIANLVGEPGGDDLGVIRTRNVRRWINYRRGEMTPYYMAAFHLSN